MRIQMSKSANQPPSHYDQSDALLRWPSVSLHRRLLGQTAILGLFALASLPDPLPAAPRARVEASTYDAIIQNGKVVDGSGNPWFYADVAIKNGRIAKIGKIDPKLGNRIIDAKGMVVTPGFIDLHTHTDMPALADG